VCGGYAWGVAALAHMYDKLGDASLAGTKQLGVFITLLQVNIKSNLINKLYFITSNFIYYRQSWIYEHFPSMGKRDVAPSYNEALS